TLNIPQEFDPLDVDFVTGPLTIKNTQIQTPTQPQTQNQIQVQSQTQIQNQNLNQTQSQNTLNSLTGLLSQFSSILDSIKKLDAKSQELIGGLLKQLIDAFQSVLLQLGSSNSASTNQTSTTQNINSSQATSTLKINKTVTGDFSKKIRYVKDDISKSGWVAIREMEFYDDSGNKIKPVDATSSCDWCNYEKPPSYSVGPKGVFDNNWETVWNAGETADDCNWYIAHMRDDGIWGVGCSPNKIRKAWINVDLGKEYNLSKIRIQVMGSSILRSDGLIVDEAGNKITNSRVDVLYGSIDGKDYYPICKLENNVYKDSDWIECVK
ncbi:MAG: hypothetical protein ACP5QN_01445, partial [Minisyncoccia bacterium]